MTYKGLTVKKLDDDLYSYDEVEPKNYYNIFTKAEMIEEIEYYFEEL